MYALAWGFLYLTADRSEYHVVFDSNHPLVSIYPRIPFQNIFPDPGFDSAVPAQAFLVGLAILVGLLVLAIARRLRSLAAPSS
jgi:hypothetical protein